MSTSYELHKKRKLNNTTSVFNVKDFELHEAAEGETEEEYDSEIDNDINHTASNAIKRQSEISHNKRLPKHMNPLIPTQNNKSYHSIDYMLEQMKQPTHNNNISKTNNISSKRSKKRRTRPLSPPPVINYIANPSTKPVLPSIKDPNLWLLPCKKGTEEFAVQTLLENKDKYEYNPHKKVFIYDTFITDINNGYIYVEADKKCHVELACKELQCSKPNKIKLVPLNERSSVFRMRYTMQNNSNSDDDLGDVSTLRSSMKSVKCTFVAGEKIKVANGPFINLNGIIISVKDSNNIIMRPNDTRLDDQIFSSNELIKVFYVGSFVKVIYGKYKNFSGTVVEIYLDTNKALICNKMQSKNISVNINNITEIEQTKACNFGLYDFICFGMNKMGIIVDIKFDQIKILDVKDQIHYCQMNDILNKAMNRNIVAFDGNNNTICIGDIVMPQIGHFKYKNVMVKQIYNHILFCYSQLSHVNAGIFVINSKQCIINGNEINSLISKKKWKGNKWISKQVKITKGFYKGMIGVVCGRNDTKLQIQLHCKNKKVKIDCNDVKLIDEKRREKGYNIIRNEARFSNCGNNTPAYNVSSTPIYENNNDSVWNPCYNYF